jgi:hypothetical protein
MIVRRGHASFAVGAVCSDWYAKSRVVKSLLKTSSLWSELTMEGYHVLKEK